LDYTEFGFYSQALFPSVDKSISSKEYRVFLRELRATRERNGLTQIDVAARLNETQSFVSKCERGERRLDIVELREFCRAIGVSLTLFVRDLDQMLASLGGSSPGRRRAEPSGR
jgi:transcriptional regulator with XRE-family HTH domain